MLRVADKDGDRSIFSYNKHMYHFSTAAPSDDRLGEKRPKKSGAPHDKIQFNWMMMMMLLIMSQKMKTMRERES